MNNQRIRVTFSEGAQILTPYVVRKFVEQLSAVLPLAGYLFLFEWIVLQHSVEHAFWIALGLSAVMAGLMFFMEGLRLGLMPLGESIGAGLPRKSPIWVVLLVSFLLGVTATLAEPAIGALQGVGAGLDPARYPLLVNLLTVNAGLLALVIGLGVGLATVLGILRFAFSFSLKWYIYPIVGILVALSLLGFVFPEVGQIVALAWDSGGITTGPVTVPLVLALGIGISRVTSKKHGTGMGGFGIVTLASLLPVAAVLVLGLAVSASGLPPATGATAAGAAAGFLQTVVLPSLQAVLPLIAFLLFIQLVLLREKLGRADEIVTGIVFCVLGMIVFNLGLSSGLIPLGNQVGGLVPGLFSQIEAGQPPTPYGPLYGQFWGQIVTLLFAFFIGYGATLAEPALNALGIQVENITQGAFRKGLLIQTVAVGVGLGIALGVAKIVYNLPLLNLLLPAYLVVLILTALSNEEMTNIGWDAAGVTTGPITVPLVIAVGLGIGANVPGAGEGFGVLAVASVTPILTVLVMGLIVKRR